MLVDFIFFILWKRKQGAEALCGLPQEFWNGFAGGLYLKVFYKPAINVPAGAAVISRLEWGRPLSGWCHDSVSFLLHEFHYKSATWPPTSFRTRERERVIEAEQTETRVFL